jgi:hypothetical protein
MANRKYDSITIWPSIGRPLFQKRQVTIANDHRDRVVRFRMIWSPVFEQDVKLGPVVKLGFERRVIVFSGRT